MNFTSEDDEDVNSDEEEKEMEDAGSQIQLMSGHKLLLAEDDTAELTALKRQRRKRKKSKHQQLDSDTAAALKHQEVSWSSLHASTSLSCFQAANAFRNAHRIYTKGDDIPDALSSFDDLIQRLVCL